MFVNQKSAKIAFEDIADDSEFEALESSENNDSEMSLLHSSYSSAHRDMSGFGNYKKIYGRNNTFF